MTEPSSQKQIHQKGVGGMNQEPEEIDPLYAGQVVPQPGKPLRQDMVERTPGRPRPQVRNGHIPHLVYGCFEIGNNSPVIIFVESVVGDPDIEGKEHDTGEDQASYTCLPTDIAATRSSPACDSAHLLI